MRLTRAGIALIIALLIICPLGAGLSYAVLSGTSIGPLSFGARATATVTPTRPAIQASTAPSSRPSAAPSPSPRASSSAAPSTGAAPGGSTAPGTTTTAANPRPSAAPSGAPTATAAQPGQTPTAPAGAAITVAYDSYAPYFPVRIAEAQGYYRARNLNVKQIGFGLNGDFNEEQRRAALKDGTFDVLLTTLDAVALFPDDQVGKVVAIVDESAGADKIVARAPITRLNDLRGKRIAYSAGSVGEFYLYASLNLVGLKASDVQLRPVGTVDEAVDLFVQNQVDAVVGWEPTIQAAIDSGGKVLLGSDNYRAILDVMVVSTKVLNEKPAAVQAFVDAWFEAVKLTIDDPQAAGAAVVQSGDGDWTGVSAPGDYTDALKLAAQATLGQNVFALRTPALLANRLTEIGAVWRAGGKTLANVDPTRLVDGGLVAKSPIATLNSTQPPLNPSFTLAQQIAAPQLTPEQTGQAQAVAELPLKQVEFQPDSTNLTERGTADILAQIVPVLKQTPGLYLRVEGSAYQPATDTPQQNEAFARARAQAVIFYLIGQGIDPNRLIEGYLKPQFPGSTDPNQQAQDRRVVFTLVQPGGR
jgi:NitT/TauT family transport system substrate-binding protein